MKCVHCGQGEPTAQSPRFTGAFPYGQQPKPGSHRESVKNYEEIATIDTICHRRRQGDGLRAIARWLNHTGVRTRKGTDWQATQIRRILRRAGLI
ncbi:recombinase family protein [Mariniblastus sp.]|nr:recombinase family protein [Mariniblastus sp.]